MSIQSKARRDARKRRLAKARHAAAEVAAQGLSFEQFEKQLASDLSGLSLDAPETPPVRH